ncbi:MAG: GAF domain-containing protein, partial [SAR202 cluster bacterium]|nr:GAF domain-containing protein [SAR202 cluster bacterium]
AELIGAQIAGAVANAQMHSQIQREADERAVLAEISRVMDSSTDIQDIFQTFTEQVNKLLQSDRIAVTLLNQDGVTATNAYVWGVDIPGFGAGETFAARTSAIGRVARTHKPILMNSESESADFDEFPLEESRLQSLLMVPLVSEDRLMGVLSLRSKQPDAYTNQDLDLAERISAQISGAVANAVLRSELQRNADLRGRLATIGRIVSSNVNIDEVYESFIEQVNALIPSDRIVVAILSEDQTSATNAYVWGTDVSDFSSGAVHTIQNTSLQHLVETRRGLIIREDPDNSAVSRVPAQVAGMARGLLSMVAAPLISGDKVIGGLNLRSKTPDAYGQRELELAELIGAQIAGAIDNAQKNLQIQQEAKERTALAEIGRIIDSSIDIQDVYQRFTEQVNLLIPSDRIVVSVFDDEQRIVTNAYVWGTDISGFNLGAGHPIQNTSLRSAIQTRRGSIVRDEAATAVADRTPSQIAALAQGLRSLVAAPLTSGDKVIGALVLRSKTPSAYDRRDVEIAELIAAQIAGAVANAQMHLQIQRQAEERAALAEIGRIINSSIDIQDVYPRFIEVVNRLIPSDRIAVALMNPEEDAVINTYVWGTEIAGLGVGGVTPVQGTAIETLFNTRKGVVMAVNSPEEFIDQFPAQVASIAVGLRSMILAPLTADDKMIGALLLRSRQPNAYNVREMELAERIAAQISGAVANSQLHADVRKQALERQVLNEIGRIISSTLDVEDVYDIFADRVRKLLPFDNLIINIVDTVNEGFRRAYSIGTTRSPIPDGVMAPSKGTLLHDVVTAKQTMHFRVNDRDTVKRKYPLLIRVFDRGYRSFIGVPLISNDQVVGTLHFNSKDIDVYTENEVSLATRIGSQIAGAVANSLMFAAQQRAERLLEQSNEELEITVQARTSELSKANSSLQNSQDQLRALAARMEMIREDERTHISHEIHDEIGQALTGLKFDIAWIRRRMDGLEDDDLRKAVSQRILSIYGDIDKNINLVRDLSTRLRPAALDNFGLSAAIESETLEFQERTNIKCEVNTPDEDIDIGKDAALGVFRILQEAMTNAARHARPTTITVDLEQDSEQIILRITDDGKGMADISDTSSLGLLGMKERARLMGGDLRIESALNKGTTVLLSAPIQGQATE